MCESSGKMRSWRLAQEAKRAVPAWRGVCAPTPAAAQGRLCSAPACPVAPTPACAYTHTCPGPPCDQQHTRPRTRCHRRACSARVLASCRNASPLCPDTTSGTQGPYTTACSLCDRRARGERMRVSSIWVSQPASTHTRARVRAHVYVFHQPPVALAAQRHASLEWLSPRDTH